MKKIKLTQGKDALVEDEDFERLNKFKWRAKFDGYNWYAYRNNRKGLKNSPIAMHREILNLSMGDGKYIDHINHYGLDNRKSNLRVCTHAENLYRQRSRIGSSRYKGVSWNKQSKKWTAYIAKNGLQKHLGYFKDEMIAALIYDLNAIKYFGEFASTNF